MHHTFRLQVVNRPGVLTAVAQVFALLETNIDDLILRSNAADRHCSEIFIFFTSDPRTADLAGRKLRRLLDVLDLEHRAAVERPTLPIPVWNSVAAPIPLPDTH